MLKIYWIISLTIILSSCGSSIKNGYTDKISYSPEDSISIFINAKKNIKDYQLDITDINGNVLKSFTQDIFPQSIHPNKPYENGFKYQLTGKISTPNFESGIYLFNEKIPFVIKPTKPCDILILYSSNTENAYCESGGKSTYGYNSSNKVPASIVSFRRPIGLPFHSTEFLRWIAKNKEYKIGYIADQDLDEYKNISSAKLLIIPGHSEYWTRKARNNFDRFISEGKNALILSGNTMWWQVRYNEEENQMICYKNDTDPIKDTALKTINWTDSTLQYSVINSIGLDFNLGGYGKKEDKGWDGYKIVTPSSPLLKGTGLKLNSIINLPTDEYDGGQLVFSSDSTNVTLNNPSNFYRYELIGYDIGSRKSNSNGAWIVMQKNENSGVIINTGSTDWCQKAGMEGRSSKVIKKITLNMIDLLLKDNKNYIFTTK
jgi:hypothetical protein